MSSTSTILSLLEIMKALALHELTEMIIKLGTLESAFVEDVRANVPTTFEINTHESCVANFEMFLRVCDEFNCKMTRISLAKAKNAYLANAVEVGVVGRGDRGFQITGHPQRVVLERLQDGKTRLIDELSDLNFLQLSQAEIRLLKPQKPLFGQAVHDAFPSARYDIEEAGKCFALVAIPRR